MRIAIYETGDAPNTSMARPTFELLAERLRSDGHEVGFIPVLAGKMSARMIEPYFRDVDVFFANTGNLLEIRVNGEAAYLHDLLATKPFRLVFFMPVPLLSRPAIARRVANGNNGKAKSVSWIYFDPDFPAHYRALSGTAPDGVKLDRLFPPPGVNPSHEQGGISLPPRILLHGRIKPNKPVSFFDPVRLADCIERLQSEPDADIPALLAAVFGEEISRLAANPDILEAMAHLYQWAANSHRAAIIAQLCQLPSSIYTSVDVLGQVFPQGLRMHPDCKILPPQDYVQSFNDIQRGDIVVCPPVWTMRNIFTERCMAAMYRGGIPVVPDAGTHIEALDAIGHRHTYSIQRPASIQSAIEAIQAGSDRGELARTAIEYATRHASFDGFYEKVAPLFVC